MILDSIIKDIQAGKPILVVDDYDRENEADLVIAAERARIDNLAFIMLQARGLMCLPCSGDILDRLQVPMMVPESTDKLQTPFTVSIDAVGTSTGMSVTDRLQTIQVLLNPQSKPSDLQRPGHLFPLRARDALLKERRGHTEASIELMRVAGCKPVAIIAEVIDTTGFMMKGEALAQFAAQHQLSIISVQDIYDAIYNQSLQRN